MSKTTICPDCSRPKDHRAKLCRPCNLRKNPPNLGKGQGWKRTKAGYVTSFINGKYTLQHRYVWEEHNGPILKGYHIHHKNGKRDDNRLENLELLIAGEHHSLHLRERMTTEEARRLANLRWN